MNINSVQSFKAGAALTAFRNTKLTADKTLVYTGAGEAPLGTTIQDYAADYAADIHLHSCGGEHQVTAANDTPINPGDPLTTAADGKVTKAAAGQTFFWIATDPSGGADSRFGAIPAYGALPAAQG
jgi:hypothetical protein